MKLNYFYLTLFDQLWMRITVYAVIFIGITLFLCAFILFIPISKKTMKEKAQFYGYRVESKKAKEKFEYKKAGRKGLLGWMARLVSKIASKRGFIGFFEVRLERAGMSIRASEFITLHLIAVIVVIIVVYFLTGNILLTLLIDIVVIFSPFLLLGIKTSQRLKKFHEQLPDTLQLISGFLKAGYSFNQALSMVVDESRPPISDEFKRILSEMRMGLPEREALENMSKRVNSEHFEWAVTAINVQREVGGNLAAAMEILSDNIRERDRVMNHVKALTSEGRLSAIILITLPIAVGSMLVVVNREYISLLITTKPGLIMLALAGVMMVAGIFWIIKIVRIKY